MLKKLETTVWLEQLKAPWTFLFVLFLAILFFPLRGAIVSPDSTFYMSVASNLNQGLGYIDTEWSPILIRGPVFPSLIALSFRLFGESVESALHVVRLFFVGNLLIIYWLGKQLGGRAVGLFAVLLVLTSSVIHYWSARVHLDNAMPFFILLSNAILFIAIKKENMLYFAMAGLTLGIGFLVKDVAGLFALTPIALWLTVSSFRKRKNIPHLFVYGITFAALAFTWLIYAASNDSSNYFLNWIDWIVRLGFQPTESASSLGAGAGVAGNSGTTGLLGTLFAIPLTIFERLKTYYEVYVAETFALAPLFLLAWIYIIYRAIRYRKLEDIFPIILCTLFLPIMLFLGSSGFRAGQTVYTYLLFYLVLAYALVQFLAPALWLKNYRWLFCIAILVAQLFVAPSPFFKLLREHNLYGFVPTERTYTFSYWGQNDFESTGWDNPEIRQVGHWIEQNVADNEDILSDWEWLDAYYFYSKGTRPIHSLEYITSGNVKLAEVDQSSPIRFIWTQGSTNPADALNNLLAFSEPHFLSQVKKTSADYIIFSQQRSFLTIYLRTHPNFVQVAEFDAGRIQIFKIIPDVELEILEEFPLIVSNRVAPYLRNLRTQRGQQHYNQFKQTYFTNDLGLDEAVIRELETGTLPRFNHNAIVTHQVYAEILKQLSPELSTLAISVLEEQSENISDNIWVLFSLVHLHQMNEQYEPTSMLLTRITSMIHKQPIAYPTLTKTYRTLRTQIDANTWQQEGLVDTYRLQIEQNTMNIQAYWQLARIFELQADWENAINIYERTLEQWPQSAGTIMRMAWVYRQQGRLEEAKSAYAQLLTMKPDDDRLPDPADIHLEIGKIMLAQAQGVSN